GVVDTADGRRWNVAWGVVRSEAEYRAEARMLAAPGWALRWFSGAPYLWGGRTEWGVDCSGMVQATYAARGIGLPRDSDQQALAGRAVAIDPAGTGYSAGDILCFADGRRISHVALWAGTGHIVHSALSRGGVASDDLFADTPAAQRLRGLLVAGRGAEAALGGARPGALPGRGLRLGFRATGGPAGGGRTARGGGHSLPLRGRGCDRDRRHAGRRRVRPADRRAQRGRRHRLLRCRRAARRRRRVRVRHARRHGRGPRRHLRVSRTASAAVDELEVKAR